MSAGPQKLLPTLLDGAAKRLLIGGEWLPAASGRTFATINPSTGEVLAQLAEGDRADIDRAVDAARRAAEGPWKRFKPAQRQNVLLALAELVLEHYEELRLLDIVEMGAPISPGLNAGAEEAAETLRYYAGWATKIHGETVTPSIPDAFFAYTLKQPVGVVGAIVPWNAPLSAAIEKIAPVLATGCTMVLKPAEEASLSPLRIGELIAKLDLPPGVVNIVTGYGETAGVALTEHLGVDKIAFTGSSVTGQQIVRAAAGNLKRVSLELGGKSPDIILADADLEEAVAGAGMGVFWNSGQVCCAGTRLFVERAVHDEFVDRLAELARSLRVGDSMDPDTEIGPIISEQQLRRVTGYLESGCQQGARAVAGGTRLTDGVLANGFFVAPTVFADVEDKMLIARDEIFGPVASVLAFDTIDEVIHRANDTDFGLGGGVWTHDIGKAHRLAEEIRTGIVWINTYNQFDPAMPFGGCKMSGWGREMSIHSLDEYLNVKAVWVRTG